MTNNQLMTGAAVAFAGFAAWYALRKPGGKIVAQPGAAQRQSGLAAFTAQWAQQADEIQNTSYALSLDAFKDKLGMNNK